MANVVDRLGGASSNLAFKAPCRLGTTANITLSGFQTIDGTLPTSSDHVDLRRILVKNQTDAAENGTYIMDTGTWARTKDFDGVNDFRQGTRLYVYGGATQSGTYIVTSSVDPSSFDLDTDDITFAAVGTFDEETASLGVSSGGKISFDSDDVTITHSSSALAFAGAGAGYTFAEGVTMSSAVTVSGAVTLSSAVTMSGAVTASSAMTVSGTITASSALLAVIVPLTVIAELAVTAPLIVTAELSVTAPDTVTADDMVTPSANVYPAPAPANASALLECVMVTSSLSKEILPPDETPREAVSSSNVPTAANVISSVSRSNEDGSTLDVTM